MLVANSLYLFYEGGLKSSFLFSCKVATQSLFSRITKQRCILDILVCLVFGCMLYLKVTFKSSKEQDLRKGAIYSAFA